VTDFTAKIAALEGALASGELSVESDGDKVTYRSVADLSKSLDYFRRQQAAADAPGGVARPATTFACYDPR
jgi:hypothetical protein